MDSEERRQPESVSEAIYNYLRMTAPRNSRPRQAPRPSEQDVVRVALDNEGLSLAEGNDFA